MTPKQRMHYATDAAILADARISDDPKVMCISELAREVQAEIVTARLHGFHPVSVRWPGGLFALMFCEPGTHLPSPQKVINAYRQCTRTTQVFPQGTKNE